ncbi:MAG: hypothetical protein ABIP94_17490, partial [Planctomycetota bacterium]
MLAEASEHRGDRAPSISLGYLCTVFRGDRRECVDHGDARGRVGFVQQLVGQCGHGRHQQRTRDALSGGEAQSGSAIREAALECGSVQFVGERAQRVQRSGAKRQCGRARQRGIENVLTTAVGRQRGK